jgi:hypothetical protein
MQNVWTYWRVGQLAEQGMSTRAIGSALGVSHATVERDREAPGTFVPGESERQPAKVTGLLVSVQSYGNSSNKP